MLFLLLCLACFSHVYGGSRCPARSEIYPCICLERPVGKSRFETTVICHGLPQGEALIAIENGLTKIEIDKFLLYDSYWTSNLKSQQSDARIPVNILSSFMMKEIEMVDTGMSSFACPDTYNCRTSFLKRFTSINCTIDDKSACSNGFSIKSWISCSNTIEELTIDKGYATELSLKPEYFPEPLPKLRALHLPNNRISRIDKRTFSHVKFPALTTLDLSHNLLRDAKNLFSSVLKIKTLDLSYNELRSVFDFQNLPNLQILKLNNNQFVTLIQSDWQIPSTVRHMDLLHNDILCDCSSKWINGTLHVSTSLMGTCANPPEVVGMKIRRASRFLVERCNEQGQIGPKIS